MTDAYSAQLADAVGFAGFVLLLVSIAWIWLRGS